MICCNSGLDLKIIFLTNLSIGNHKQSRQTCPDISYIGSKFVQSDSKKAKIYSLLTSLLSGFADIALKNPHFMNLNRFDVLSAFICEFPFTVANKFTFQKELKLLRKRSMSEKVLIYNPST